MNRGELERRAAQWRRHGRLRRALLALAVALLAAALVWRSAPVAGVLAGLLSGVVVWIRMARRDAVVTAETVAAHLNRICPSLEESAALWLHGSDTLTVLERLQLRRLNAAWEALPDRQSTGIPPAGKVWSSAGFCALGGIALFVGVRWPVSIPPGRVPMVESGTPVVSATIPPALESAKLRIEPPAYTGKPSREIEGFDAEVEEGANVSWEMALRGDATHVALESAGSNETVALESLGGGKFRARSVVSASRLYQIAVMTAAGRRVVWPQLHTLKIVRDEPPRLVWQLPAATRSLVGSATPMVSVRLTATDDYGVTDVHLVATVAKGSGEGVKFREQSMSLTREADGMTYGRDINLRGLGLEPGDELYFHAEAADNRMPRPNHARSETRFVTLRGPTGDLADLGLAVKGVNLVPQYFRSQRQLIIDTERLLAERPQLTEAKVRERAEEIGVDQKLLRLRYGQFLGEEFEPDASGAPREAQGIGFAARLQGRDPESANRAAAIDRAVEQQHRHEANAAREGRPATFEELRAPLVHQHDNAEVATVFDQQVKASLRAVLAAMWEAEGFLRSGRPDDALPAENRALELLKELQQADRVYVKRVGFEPAPLKIDERRLRGELEAVPRSARADVPRTEPSAEVTAVQAMIAAIGREETAPVPAEVAAAVEARLTAAAREQPEMFAAALEILRRRPDGLTGADKAKLRRSLWMLAPSAQATPQAFDDATSELGRKYFDALSASGARAR